MSRVPLDASRMIIIASLMREQGTTGVQAHMREFQRWLQQAGQAHAVITPFCLWTWPLLAGFIAIRHVLEATWKPGAVWLYRQGHAAMLACRLWWRLRRQPGAVVYAQCPLSARVALRLARPGQSVTLVVHFNGSQADEWVGKGMLRAGDWLDSRIRRLEQDTLARLHGVVYVSEFMRQTLSSQVPALQQVPATVVPNFVQRLSGPALPNMVGRDLIAVGTLEPRKNQRYLLQVLARAKQAGRRIQLTLVGDGPDRAMLESLAAELDVADQVDFVGFHPQARTLIAGHKLCVHAALMENLPMALIEALSAGVPVVAAPVGGIGEIFRDGVEGGFWPLDDAEAGARLLMQLLADEAGLSRLCQAARARFDAQFDADVIAARLARCLLGLNRPEAASSGWVMPTRSH